MSGAAASEMLRGEPWVVCTGASIRLPAPTDGVPLLLAALARGPGTSSDVALRAGVTSTVAQKGLVDAYRAGAVTRTRLGPGYLYTLAPPAPAAPLRVGGVRVGSLARSAS